MLLLPKVRTTGEQAYRITDFTVRICAAADVRPLSQEEVATRSFAVLGQALDLGREAVGTLR